MSSRSLFGLISLPLVVGTSMSAPTEAVVPRADAAVVPTRAAYVTTAPVVGGIALAAKGSAATFYVGSGEYPGVVRAARAVSADLAAVSGAKSALITDRAPRGNEVVIAGTIGRSALIDSLVRAGRLDVSAARGKWETFVTQIVDAPLPGVTRALVIAGSDKRGTIYGLYDLSAQMGVSPWSWWADVPLPRHPTLFVAPGTHSMGEPAVRYRGIFINDEAPGFSGWTREKFGGVNHKAYEHVFELILRLKGNYLWPAMWGNAFADDDSLNAVLADEYGVVMGTSHHEPLTRAQQEWKRYGTGPWNYEQNDSTLRAFWRAGIQRMGTRENIVTVGMRGDGDMPMTEGSNIALLERIVADQRKIIADVTHRDASATPQLWALYKEVQDYYDRGMRVPDDVTLLFADDNWGNIRRLPEPGAKARSGGYGVYYHFDYVGGPRNYKWLNTNPIARVWEQMQTAHALGADRIWIVNVGDIKPMEFPIQFFLDFAWNPAGFPADSLPSYTKAWAAQQFGDAHAPAIAKLVTQYLTLAGRRKPELLDPDTYSLVNFREAERVMGEFAALRTSADSLATLMAVTQRDAYFQLVQHPIQALANQTELYITVGQNRLYATQGRASTNALAERARALFERDVAIARRYNHEIAGGKWNHLMDQTHIGYTYWQEPPRNVMPRVDVIQLPDAADMGVAVVEVNRPAPQRGGPGGGSFAGGQPAGFTSREPTLPMFDPYNKPTHYVDVFNRGRGAFTFTAAATAPWLTLSPATGQVTTETRVAVRVDWTRAPLGTTRIPIVFTASTGAKSTVTAVINNPASPRPEDVTGFVAANGYVAMEAEHTSRRINASGISWQRIPNLGRTLSAMRAAPISAPSLPLTATSPHLEYDVTLFDSGTVRVHAMLSPSLNVRGLKNGLRYGVSFDNDAPEVVNSTADSSNAGWEKSVGENIRDLITRHRVATAGKHTLKFWYVDPGVVLQRLVIETSDLPNSYLGPPESFHRSAGGPATFDWFEYTGHDAINAKRAPTSGEFLNPILAGFYPDPALTRVGSDYYIVNSTFTYFPGIPVFHSRDLVNWSQIGNVISRPSQLNFDSLGISRGVFAPTIEYHNGTYYVFNTCVDCGGNFVVTASRPEGPYSDPVWLRDVDGIDPSVFFDDDGKAYVLNNGAPIGTPLYDGHRAIWIQEFDAKTLRTFGERTLIVNGGVDLSRKPIWIEGPHLFRKDGWYYLTAAEGGTAEGHSQVVLRSKAVRGPYTPYAGNPILTQRHLPRDRAFPVTSTGHANLVETTNGEWWAIFLGTRPYEGDFYNIGRETFLMPVHWRDGWPIITTDTQTVPFVLPRPKLASTPAPPFPTHGNFTVRDEFDGPSLAPYWNLIRTPRESWYDFTSTRGAITLQARHADIGARAQPSFIGRRQQHANATATTSMRYVPRADGDEAGLIAFQNDAYYLLLAVTRVGGAARLQVEQRAGAGTGESARVLASAPMPTSDTPVELRITVSGATASFAYRVGAQSWISLLSGVDARMLSTKTATGFVGTMFGLYAYSATP